MGVQQPPSECLGAAHPWFLGWETAVRAQETRPGVLALGFKSRPFGDLAGIRGEDQQKGALSLSLPISLSMYLCVSNEKEKTFSL